MIGYGSYFGIPLRGAYKMALLLGFILLVFLIQPLIVLTTKRLFFRTARFVHHTVSKILELQITVRGKPCTTGPVLYIANHTSYLDIPTLGSLITGCFVAKGEIEGWPVFGQLCKMQETIFIKRKATEAGAQRDFVREKLLQNKNVIVFAEGTSTDGRHVLPFRSSLFASVREALPDGRPIMIQPISITAVTLDGLPLGRTLRPLYAWYGDMTIANHGWPMLKLGKLGVVIEFHPPVANTDFADRKALAQHCHRAVQQGVISALTGRASAPALPAPPAAPQLPPISSPA
jgi:lyso-ornithine lipid O-acyltransferase